VVVWLSSEN